MFDTLIQIDKQLLLAVNGGDSLFMDILIKILYFMIELLLEFFVVVFVYMLVSYF